MKINNEFVQNSDILVVVTITLDIPSRKLTFNLKGLDKVSREMPIDPFLGILYPNDDKHRGEGSILFTVKLNKNLSPGTVISN